MYSVKEMSYYDLVSLLVKEPSEVINNFPNPQTLYQASPEELHQLPGVSKAKSMLLAAAIELGRRSTVLPKETPVKITCPSDVFNLLGPEMSTLDREHFRLLSLNHRKMVLGQDKLFIGGISSCIVDLRIVFGTGIRRNCSNIILVHNHPSLDPNIEPSKEDIEISKKIANAGEILNITLLDSIIVGNGYCSLKERGLL